jgi:hypothetical protein
MVRQRMTGLERDNLVRFINTQVNWGNEQRARIAPVLHDYCVGHSTIHQRTVDHEFTVFWQIDYDGHPRTAHYMKYKENGHRLKENEGKYVIVEFLIGAGSLTSHQSTKYYVGAQFLVLYDEFESRFVVCDIFSVKFVTFLEGRSASTYPMLDQTAVPGSASNPDVPAVEAGAFTPSQAAYAHATRRNPSQRF